MCYFIRGTKETGEREANLAQWALLVRWERRYQDIQEQ